MARGTSRNHLSTILAIACLVVSIEGAARDDATPAADSLVNALTAGKVDLGLRLRYEHVDDDGAMDQADGLTLRTTLGYTTGEFEHVFARLLVQDVRDVGVDDFNDGTGRPNARTNFAVIADPSETDFLEGYLGFTGLPDTTVKVGRQIVTYRPAPFHRFLGTVLWRQNWQNHDAFTVRNESLPDTTIQYAYSWNVNRIFTDEAVISARANFDSDSHLVNLQYAGFPYGELEAYAYLLDFDNAAANSTATYGARFDGSVPAGGRLKLLYALEYATQDDYANNPARVDEDYFLGEIGAGLQPAGPIDSLTVKLDYELLTGDGTSSFRTPLATGHAFQGWADRFLTTPADGIEDIYVTVALKTLGFNLTAVYHELSSDHDDYDYGTEIDLLASRKFGKRVTAGVKYSDYDADGNALNRARGGSIALDVSKFWAWVQFNY